ncbi:MAG TPA: signal peptidase I [Gemmataceae bacterium]|nr:signal peptidase I [Gemmataceae bacterium]
MDAPADNGSPSATAPGTSAVTAAPPRHPVAGRRLIESAVLFLSVLLLIRVVGVEPYSVPTGSMAPTLMGNHWAAVCPRCGYLVRVGVPNGNGERHFGRHGHAACPNCGCDELPLDQTLISRGDQLLVNKNVFDWRRPRRWEMAVFRCPVEPGKEFVKRVVGLPGEEVQLRDGDVYIDHDLARKTLEEFQRLRILLFDHNYQPADGWQTRWQIQPPPLTLPSPPAGREGRVREGPAAPEGTGLRLNALRESDAYLWLGYRNWLLDVHKEEAIRDEYSYNGGDPAAAAAVHDFMLECDLEVLGGDGWVAFAITDGLDEMTAELPIGTVKEGARLIGRQPTADLDGESRVYRTAPDFGLRVGRTYHVGLAFVDRRATLVVDGRPPFAPVDRPAAEQRGEVTRPVKVGARGVDVRLSNIRLFRDVHYTEAGQHGVRAPVRLGAGQYFVLGDNSPNSDDSRFWSDPEGNPAPVPEAYLVGKPFLVHLPSRAVRWQGFGRQWQHQVLDWKRVRWLR